jgi:cyclopropane fatty-acyl-phospholipid synthase-like methyltransferase
MGQSGSTILVAMFKEIRSLLVATPAERRHLKVGWLHFWKLKREFQIRFLRDAGLSAEHCVLDVGCGTLRGGIPLIDYLEAGHYYGIDARAAVLEEAKQELREAGLEHKAVTLVHADNLAGVNLRVEFDVIWAFAVLFHMSDEILDSCFGLVGRHLRPSGAFYANVKIGRRKDARWKWQGFPVVWRTWEFYQDAAARHGLVVTDLGTLASLGNVSGVRTVDEERMLKFERARP